MDTGFGTFLDKPMVMGAGTVLGGKA